MVLVSTKYCTIAVVFCAIFQDGLTAEVATINLTCASKWQKLKLNWLDSTLTRNFSSFWRRNGEEFKRQTIERLSQTAIYPYSFTQIVSCHGTVASNASSWVNNVSFNVTLPKVGSELLGIRFLSRPNNQKTLEFYLRPRPDISYSLSYCCESCNSDLGKSYTCPIFREVNFNCLWRDRNVYRIANSDGSICEASTLATDYINIYYNYKFNIRSTTPDGFGSVSADFLIFTKESNFLPISEYAKQGLFTIVLMGRKSEYLTVHLRRDLVRYYC